MSAGAAAPSTLATPPVGETSAQDAVANEFMELVEEWLKAHPVRSTTLSRASVSFACGKLLIWKSGGGAKLDWPGKGYTRLIGILLVLFVEDGLALPNDNAHGERQVMGFNMSELFQIIQHIIQLKKLTREEVVGAVVDVDVEGTALPLVQSNEVAATLFKGTQVKVAEEEASAPAVARGLLMARVIIIAFCAVLLAMSDHMWTGLDRVGRSLLPGRIVFSHFSLTLGVLSIVLVYPNDITSAVTSRRYVLPVTLASSAVGLLETMRAYWLTQHVNEACRVVHLLLCVGVTINSYFVITRLGLGRFRWAACRTVLVTDGLIYISAAVALRLLGPPPLEDSYPPSNATFASACASALYNICFGLSLTPSNRHRLLQLTRYGWRGWKPLATALEAALEPPDENGTVVESAGELKAMSLPLQKVVRRQLAKRYLHARLLLVLLAGAWFVMNDTLRLWQWEMGRLASMGMLLTTGAFFVAGSFPTDLSSPAGRAFILPGLTICAAASGISGYMSWPPLDGLEGVFFISFRRVLSLCIVADWTACAVLCALSRCTWTVLRSTFFVDGALFGVASVVMRYIGPPLVYPPRNNSFPVAIARSALTIGIAVILSARTRRRIADVANRFGWNHVTLALNQVHRSSGNESTAGSNSGGGGSKDEGKSAVSCSSTTVTSSARQGYDGAQASVTRRRGVG